MLGFWLLPVYPWGQLPLLEIGDKKIAQSNAIARYLAKKYNLAGKDDWESAKIDEIVDAMADLRNGEFHFLFPPFVWMGENLGK